MQTGLHYNYELGLVSVIISSKALLFVHQGQENIEHKRFTFSKSGH